METEILGEGEPEYALLCLVHGDELSGRDAIDRIIEEIKKGELDRRKPFKVVYASTEAAENGEKFIDQDLNRSFPGEKDSEVFEERLAARVAEELQNLKVLDLHTTASRQRFGVVLDQSDESIEEVSKTGVSRAVDFDDSSAEIPGCTRVAVEASSKANAVDDLYSMAVSYLSCSGVVDAECESSDPDLFEIYESVEGSRWKFDSTNFQKVEEGEVYAFSGDEQLRATESFYPVLMSDDGYEDIIGFKARKI